MDVLLMVLLSAGIGIATFAVIARKFGSDCVP
jgi:hypothetical protein